MQNQFGYIKDQANEILEEVNKKLGDDEELNPQDAKELTNDLLRAINLYGLALNKASQNKEKASVYKNTTIAHELMCKIGHVDEELKLYHFA